MRKTIIRVATAVALGLTLALAVGSPAQAQIRALGKYQALGDQFYNDPEPAQHRLRFADLEASMATDPLSWSSDPGWKLHRTPAREMSEATDLLRAAVPAGTPATQAEAVLQRAGARCASASATQLVCQYRDVETPNSGQYWDNVLWRVWLDRHDGRVSNLVVTRDWTRR